MKKILGSNWQTSGQDKPTLPAVDLLCLLWSQKEKKLWFLVYIFHTFWVTILLQEEDFTDSFFSTQSGRLNSL